MKACFFLLRRYLLPRQGSLLTFGLWLSIAGVALGIIQLMIVLSVMSGFREVLEARFTRISGELVIIPPTGASTTYTAEITDKVSAIRGVRATTPFLIGQAMIVGEHAAGVVLEGIDSASWEGVVPTREVFATPPVPSSADNWIWVGGQLAKKLHLKIGDSVDVLVVDASGQKTSPFVVTGITKFGIYDHDLRYARIDIQALRKLFGMADARTMLKVVTNGQRPLNLIEHEIKRRIGDRSTVRRWSDLNQNIFLAVQHQKKLLFLILEIVVALAAVNVVNLLMMSSYQRRRDIAIWRSMGMRRRSIFAFFLGQGASVGALGVAIGVVLGCGICLAIPSIQPFALREEIYNVTRLPVKLEWTDVLAVSSVALAVCIVFSILPALRAIATRPVDTLRQEQ